MDRRTFGLLVARALAGGAATHATTARWLTASAATPFVPQLRPQPIDGYGLNPYQAIITIDDAPDEIGPDGENQTIKMARYLHSYRDDRHPNGISATFFVVGCHFLGQPPPDPRSWICGGRIGTQPLRSLWELNALGHTVGNHTQDHIPLVGLTGDEVRYQVGHWQRFLDRFQRNGLRLLRTPGLGYSEDTFRELIADPDLWKLTGPIDQDAGGQGYIDGKWIRGDWDAYRLGYSAIKSSELYVRAATETTICKGHGPVILFHARTEYMDGSDGSGNFPLDLLRNTVERLTGIGYEFVPITAIPGILPEDDDEPPSPRKKDRKEP